jgi:alcohol dehydrogenase
MRLPSDLIGNMVRTVGLPGVKRLAGLATRVVPIPQPTMMVGPDSSVRLGHAVSDHHHRKVFVVTDAVIAGLGLMEPLLGALRKGGTAYVVFDEVTPDAPLPMVERGIERFEAEACDAILAFGGGSVMDAAKVIGLAAANHKHPSKLVGYFRGLRGPVPIYAVPTTAGTGSEVTVAAVVSDPVRHCKLVIADTRIVPRMAALDPCLMTGLPPAVTAATGMDALTHAVEAYLGYWGTAYTDRMALAAVGMIYEHLPVAYRDGADLGARERMALASSYAGFAFTRANVGNAHALAHQLGGLYHTPHGLANAIMLPPVLRFSSAQVTAKLAVLAQRARLGTPDEPEAELAQRFLDSVESMNRQLGIPRQLDALREEDIPALATAACREADFNYPVPRVMSQDDAEALLREVLPAPVDAARKTPRRRAPAGKPATVAKTARAARTVKPVKSVKAPATKATKATKAAQSDPSGA